MQPLQPHHRRDAHRLFALLSPMSPPLSCPPHHLHPTLLLPYSPLSLCPSPPSAIPTSSSPPSSSSLPPADIPATTALPHSLHLPPPRLRPAASAGANTPHVDPKRRAGSGPRSPTTGTACAGHAADCGEGMEVEGARQRVDTVASGLSVTMTTRCRSPPPPCTPTHAHP